MGLSKLRYRVQQFKSALFEKPLKDDLGYVSQILSDDQFTLFKRLQRSEQVHAIAVCRQSEDQGHFEPELLQAALLHDIGKIRYPIKLWERVFLVIVLSFDEKFIEKRRGKKERGGFRIFEIAKKHPAWGAELAEQAGASSLVVSLINRHQDKLPKIINTEEDRLLNILQNNDDSN